MVHLQNAVMDIFPCSLGNGGGHVLMFSSLSFWIGCVFMCFFVYVGAVLHPPTGEEQHRCATMKNLSFLNAISNIII